ncbi:MAG: Ribosomal protein L11 methyltransferase [Alphaproteobacteria bacterium MarineAlpha3_Bin5]|nr:hypothetical protein [Magnetovibrio sp.]PPR80130.1 MAG: Ribosomal protein L11 methyltransferase [Alphaproteobacteria bacterium MarineAlpha3_Bin5]|tara:strand:- start:349 stop:831 length:483 start_codon:yes stop_codon:yes gene_type:complete
MKNKTSTKKVWRIKLDVPSFCVSEVESILTPHCASISLFRDEQKETWNIEGLSEKKPDLVLIKHHLHTVLKNFTPKLSPTIDTLTPSDWLKTHVLTFCPIQLGRFRVKGEAFNENKNKNIFDICLNAGTAFGSGKHPTTALCILALDRFAKKNTFPAFSI